jgi:hypothetical protein
VNEERPITRRMAAMFDAFYVKLRKARLCSVCGADPCVCSVVEGFMDSSGPHVGAVVTTVEGGRLVVDDGSEA